MNADKLIELRQEAEKRLRGRFIDTTILKGMSLEQIRQMVHDLHTHQIELEMQNEILRQAEEALITARDKYTDLYDFAPVGYLTINAPGLIAEANLTCAEMLGVERGLLLGRRFGEFVVAEDEDSYYLYTRKVQKSTEKQICELCIKKADGDFFYSRLESQMVAGDTSLRVALSDISEMKQIEQQLVSLERLHAVGELSAGVSHNLNNSCYAASDKGTACSLSRCNSSKAEWSA